MVRLTAARAVRDGRATPKGARPDGASMFVADDANLLDAGEESQRHDGAPAPGWDSLAEPVQLALAAAAMRRAASVIAGQAETLACEMEAGTLEDRGGPEALRLLAVLVRVTTEADPA
jgi:hypothetical protein